LEEVLFLLEVTQEDLIVGGFAKTNRELLY